MSTFDAEVQSGYWPKPQRRGMKGGKLTWDRMLLDAAQDRHSRLTTDQEVEPMADPGEAAWMERIRGTTLQQRPQQRPPIKANIKAHP